MAIGTSGDMTWLSSIGRSIDFHQANRQLRGLRDVLQGLLAKPEASLTTAGFWQWWQIIN